MKKLPPKVKVEVIKKGPPADTLTGALFGTMETETMDEYKGKFDCSLGNLLCVVDGHYNSCSRWVEPQLIFLMTMMIYRVAVD